MTGLKIVRDLKRLPAKTPPTVSGSTIVAQASGTSIEILSPAAAVAGDIAYICLSVTASTEVTPPAGLTKVAEVTPDASVKLVVYLVVMTVPGGAGLTFGLSTNNAAVGGCITFRGVGGYSINPNIYQSTSTEVGNNRPKRFPSVKAGPDDLIVGISATSAYASTALAAALVTAPPAGMTIRQAQTAQNNGLQFGRGLALMTGPHHALASETYTTTNQAHNIGLIFVLSPVKPRWAEIERKPVSMGTLVHVYGTSSSAFVKVPEVNWGYNTRTPWGQRVQAAFGANPGSTNFSLPGSKAADICAFIYGNAVRSTRATLGDPLAIDRAGTWNPASTASLVLTDLIGNDIISMGTSDQALRGAEISTDAIFRLIQAESALPHNDASVTKTGTWTTANSTGLMYGQTASTSEPGNRWELSVTDKAAVDLVLVGADNTAGGNVGATYRVLLDGVEVATGTTHNQMVSTNWGGGTNYGFVPMCVPVRDIPAGTHTVTVEHTGASGSVLMVNGALFPKTNPAWIVTNYLMRSEAAESAYGYTWAGQQLYHERLRTVAERFDGRVIIYDPNKSGRWNSPTMTSSDHVHQNEIGHALYAWEIMQELSARVP